MSNILELAREAVDNKNYDLATEIYIRHLKETKEPSVEILVAAGECYAKAGRLTEALEAFTKASRLGELHHENLTSLVNSLVEKLCTSGSTSVQQQFNKPFDLFSCLCCHNILYEPTTLNCGHTFCKSCFYKQDVKRCKICNECADNLPVKVDILLCGQLEKYFPSAYKAARLRNQADSQYESGFYIESLKLYTEAAELAPLDYLIASNKSLVCIALKDYSAALREAERACKLQPCWPMGYFRKGDVQMMLGRYEEALMSILQCLSLDSTLTCAKGKLAMVLKKILTPLPTSENLKFAEVQNRLMLNTHVPAISAPLNIFSTGLDDLASAISTGFIKTDNMLGDSSPSSSIKYRFSGKKPLEVSEGSSDEDGESFTRRKRKNSDSPELLTTDISQEPQIIFKELPNHSDFECSLCFRLLYKPASTPCGHAFCMGCINRCLDHKPQCPLCKDSLVEYLAKEKKSINVLVDTILRKYFEKEFEERCRIHARELEELRGVDSCIIPVFICTMAFPTISCPLHIFEPRYKLMIRQCIESGTMQFGMCIPSQQNVFADIGCMLNILEVQMLPNGRSGIRTVGSKRFKVLSRGMRDGYNTATVSFIQDEIIPEAEISQIKQLQQSVYAEALAWFNSLEPSMRTKVNEYYGPMPTLPDNLLESPDGPFWTWWLLVILPIPHEVQLQCMAMVTIKQRLLFLQRCLRAAQNR